MKTHQKLVQDAGDSIANTCLSVDLTTLTVQQLSEVKKQLDEGQSPSGQREESNSQS